MESSNDFIVFAAKLFSRTVAALVQTIGVRQRFDCVIRRVRHTRDVTDRVAALRAAACTPNVSFDHDVVLRACFAA